SCDNSKSKLSAFSSMRSLWTDLGMVTTPIWRSQRSITWATLLLYLSAIFLRSSLSRIFPLTGKERSEFFGRKDFIIFFYVLQQSVFQSERFRMQQHFINRASGFDRPCDRKKIVPLQEQLSW